LRPGKPEEEEVAMKKTLTMILSAVTLVALAGPTTAQVRLVSDMDRDFVRKSAAGNAGELELGRVAQQRAQRPSVRAYAERMVADHGRFGTELAALARLKGIQAPTALEPHHAAQRDRLSNLAGADFDRAYMSEMVADHIATIALFEAYTPVATDPELKTWATQTLPTLRDHLTLARTVNSEVVLGPAPPPTVLVPVVPSAIPAAVLVPWCEGTYAPAGGTNFGTCTPPR
jgi:putative membrane protein